MASTDGILTIERIVTDFLLAYKKTTEDYISYLSHACRCVQDFNLFHGNEVVPLKMTVTANKFLEMPSDMIGFNDLCIPMDGQWWSFTEQKYIVNTTTFTGLVEGRDEDSGEGVEIKHALTSGYGARGAVNAYNYMIDWKARRIFLDGIDSGTVVLFYTSSGVTVNGTTYVSALLVPIIESYMLWKETYWIPELVGERQMREKDYTTEVLKARKFINSLSYNQLRDLILGQSTQTAKR